MSLFKLSATLRTSLPSGPASVPDAVALVRRSIPSQPATDPTARGAAALRRRFSPPPLPPPSPYTGGCNASARQPTAQLATDIPAHIHDQIPHASLCPASVTDTDHQYNLKSRGRDFAIITVKSHARTALDTPLLYFGEEIKGLVVLSLNDLSDMQNMDVAVSQLGFHYSDCH